MKRVIVTIAGVSLICIGVLLLVLPGPGILLILAGLAVLGTEFAFVRRWKESLAAWWAKRRTNDTDQ